MSELKVSLNDAYSILERKKAFVTRAQNPAVKAATMAEIRTINNLIESTFQTIDGYKGEIEALKLEVQRNRELTQKLLIITQLHGITDVDSLLHKPLPHLIQMYNEAKADGVNMLPAAFFNKYGTDIFTEGSK